MSINSYSLDILNRTKEVKLVSADGNQRTIYVSAYTDERQKVFEVSDQPSEHIFETEKDKQRNAATPREEVKSHRGEEVKGVEEDSEVEEQSKLTLLVTQVSLSLINKQTEVLTFVLDHWVAAICQKEQECIYEATLNRLQIDNHGQLTPLYPILLKTKTQSLQVKKDDESLENVQPAVQVYVSIKQNIPNVQYINWLEFLFAELELRIEVDHLMSIFEFAEAFNKNFEAGLASSH